MGEKGRKRKEKGKWVMLCLVVNERRKRKEKKN
jgi:hypothetical protein